MKFLTFSVLAAILITLNSVKGQIGGDIFSTMKIIYNLCSGGKDEPGVPEAFFNCYSGVTGESIFIDCQIEIFGGVLDNLEQINEACQNLDLMIPYSTCLEMGFTEAGLDMEEAVTDVNICQAEVLGIE